MFSGFVTDIIQGSEHDDKMLEEKGIKQIRNVYDGIHDWNVWRKSIRDFATLIFR